MDRAFNNQVLNAFCELELFGETEEDLSPDLIDELLDMSAERLETDLARTFQLDLSQAHAVRLQRMKFLAQPDMSKIEEHYGSY